MIRYFITTLALIALATQLWADEFEYDSRRLYDLCSPDQIEISEGVHFDWGHYQQWTTHPGTASGPGSFVATPWNTCCQAPVFRELRFEGQGELTFFVRTAHDGSSPGRHVSGPWSSWEKLNFEGRIARIPSDHQERQWIQVRCEMSQGAKLNQFSIHKQMILPDHPRLILTPQRVAEDRKSVV